MKQKHLVLLVAGIFSGCASDGDMANVIPREGGIYEIVATGEEKQETLASALSAAEETCEQRQRRFVVIDRKETYKGALVSEGANQTIDKVASVAAFAGHYVPTLSSGDDYRVTMLFKCEADQVEGTPTSVQGAAGPNAAATSATR